MKNTTTTVAARTPLYASTPHMTIEQLSERASARAAAGETASAIIQDIVDGYNLGWQSENHRLIERAVKTAPATQTAHTPGPWRVTEYGGEIAIHAEDNTKVALPEKWFASDRVEAAANAHLIAAAPELLAALESIAAGSVQDTGENGMGTVNIDRETMQLIARAALAKATGGAK